MCFAVLAHDLFFRIIQIKWSQFTRCRVNLICIIRVAQSLHSNEIVLGRGGG
jgi:hypothetical protein